MSYRFVSRLSFLLIFTTVFAMYQETPAQKGGKQAKKAPAQVTAAVPEIAYTVSMSRPTTHLLEVQMNVKWSQMPATTELKMPVWTPGSYLVREYARHVQDVDVRDAAGASLVWSKTNKNTWAVETKGAKEIVVTYKVYANELTVRTNELNDEHAFWNNGALLFFIKGQLKVPSTVKVNPAKNWRVATGLPAVDGSPNTFRAPDYDVLYDSPFEVSDFKEIKFDVAGKPHRFVVTGEGNYDLNRIAADTTKIVMEAYKIFGEFGYDNYTFILNLRGGGGLEHLNSTALQTNRFAFQPESRYKGFLGLVAHEYFHNYNVKRIRPDALGPFDYENENYTRSLWFAEGGTEYYSNLLLLRAGLITPGEYLSDRTNGIEALESRPGRYETSLEDASFDAWIKYYRPDENAVNNQISYYDKGELVTMLLDMKIRSASNGTKSLDDVMRYLWTDLFKKGRNYSPADLQKASEMMAGSSLEDFFSKYVRGTADIDWTTAFQPFGLQVTAVQPGASRAYFGADFTEDGGRLTIRSLAADSPAYAQGFSAGDQVVALDGYRASLNFVQSYLGQRKPGDKVRVTIFRYDRLSDIEVTLMGNKTREFSIAPAPTATDQQRKLYHDFFNADL